jgi:hypothetical protein
MHITITDTKALDQKRRQEIAAAIAFLIPAPPPPSPVCKRRVLAERLQRRTWGRL